MYGIEIRISLVSFKSYNIRIPFTALSVIHSSSPESKTIQTAIMVYSYVSVKQSLGLTEAMRV